MNTRLVYGNVSRDVEISFIITTYKRNQYIFDAINSIVRQPNFNKYSIEVLVISNDSTDDMADLIEEFSGFPLSVYVNEENYGMIANVNLGTKMAKGKYVAYLHDDDFLLANYLEVMMPLLDGRYECYLPARYDLGAKRQLEKRRTFFRILYWLRGLGDTITSVNFEDNVKCCYDIYCAPSCGVVFTKKSLEDFGFFKDKYGLSWDYYSFREYNKLYEIAFVHKYLSVYRVYSGLSNKPGTKEESIAARVSMADEDAQTYPFVREYLSEIKAFYYSLIGEALPVDRVRYRRFLFAIEKYYIKYRLDMHKAAPNNRLERWWQ